MGFRVSIAGAFVCLLAASCSTASNPSTPDTSDGSAADATNDSQGGNVDAPVEANPPSDGAADVRDASSDGSSPTPDASADVSVADAEAGSGDAAPDATGDTGAPDGSEEAASPTCPSAPPYNQACTISQFCTYEPDASAGGAQCCLCYQDSWLCVYDGEMGGGGGSGICPPTEPGAGICPYSDGPICYYCEASGRIEEEQCVNGMWTGQSL